MAITRLEIFEKLGLKKFEKEYFITLETFGKGGSGEVIKALEIRKRELCALKFVRLRTEENRERRKKFYNDVEGLIDEQKIINKLSSHPDAKKYFPEVYGIYYDIAKG